MSSDSAVKVIRGLAWTMTTSLGVRAVQLGGTLALTHLLLPDMMGEVANAAVLTMTVNRFSMVGVPNYIITRKHLADGLVWHGTVIVAVVGALLIGLVVVLLPWSGPWLASFFRSPRIVQFLPGLIVSAMLVRLATIPERLLQRALRFREVSLARGASELAFSVVTLGTAFAGMGGMSIVIGNVARSLLHLVLMARLAPREDWLRPSPLRRDILQPLLAFGLPLSVTVLLSYASRSWDNLAISALFGATVAGAYNLAYNLADIPANQVGEQIIDVLTPSLSQMDLEERKRELLRSTGLSALVVFPLAVGLGAVADTLVRSLLRPEWAAVAPMLTILSSLAVVRPVGWTIGMYLSSTDRTRAGMWLSVLHVVVLFGLVIGLGRLFGPLWACAGVGASFAIHAIASVGYVARNDAIPVRAFGRSFCLPLAACVPMVGAVLGVRAGLAAIHLWIPGLNLLAEVLAGGVAYIAGALVVARPMSDELLALLKAAVRKRSNDSAAASTEHLPTEAGIV